VWVPSTYLIWVIVLGVLVCLFAVERYHVAWVKYEFYHIFVFKGSGQGGLYWSHTN